MSGAPAAPRGDTPSRTRSSGLLRLEELSAPALAALDRGRSLVVLGASPLEHHGPHLPIGVDYLATGYLAQAVAERLLARRPGWTVLLAPTLALGAFAFDAVGTIPVRQRAVRDVVADWGHALARAGFRYVAVASGHAGPGHLVALEEAARQVSRRHGIRMASLSGLLAWEFLRGRFTERIASALGRPLSPAERSAFADDLHAGWWETSLMLLVRPDLVAPGFRDLPPARYSWPERLRPSFPLRNGGQGYVGHPALASPELARAALDVLLAEAVTLVERLLDGELPARAWRSPFYRIPFLRTDFWPVAALVGTGAALVLWLGGRGGRVPRTAGARQEGAPRP